MQVDRKFPKVTFSLTSGSSHENHNALRSRAIDMTLAVDTMAEVDWVELHPLLHDPYILVTAKGGDPIHDIADLSGRTLIRYGSDLLIGRNIEALLRRTGVRLSRGFEFTTNQALFAMIAELRGFAITTALAYLGAPLATDIVSAHPSPLPHFSRRLALDARSGALGSLPSQFAEQMRQSISERILPLVQDRLPFVKEGFGIIQKTESKVLKCK